MEKLERDGKVAVLYAPEFGAGWYSWNTDHEGLLFDKDIVEAVLADNHDGACRIAEEKYPDIYVGGGYNLAVEWVPKGSRFMVEEYDGQETVTILTPDFGHVA